MPTTQNPGRSQQQTGNDQPDGRGKALDLVGKGPLAVIGSYRAEWAAIAPDHVDPAAFVALAAAYVRRDSYLTDAFKANPASLILALRECAALGHVPRKGEFSLVPFKDRNAPGGWSIVGVEEWRGVVERMFRSGGVNAVHVSVGRENDQVLSFQKGRDPLPLHTYDEFAGRDGRGPLKAVWAWADLHTGQPSDVAWLNRHDVARHRSMSKTAMKAGGNGGNFWGPEWPGEGPNTEAMWRKTALHVLEGLVPTSAAYRWSVAKSGAAAAAPRAGVPDVDPAASTDWLDGEVIDAPTSGPPAAAEGADGWPVTAQPAGA